MIATATGVVIDNIGPIEHLELDAKPGTITVLRGFNGRGKSTALEAIDALTRGGSRLESRDGTVGGSASGFGVTIKVGRAGANRRTGDLVVTAVEDKLSIADFVDPGIKDPAAADGRRLKALVALAGLAADYSLFEALFASDEEFRSVVKPESLAATDPVEMAARVKRDIETASRAANTKAERIFTEITAKLSANKNLDLTAEHNRDLLQARVEECLTDLTSLRTQSDAHKASKERRDRAQVELDKAISSYSGPTSEAAQKAVEDGCGEVNSLRRMVEKLENDLREVKADLSTAHKNYEVACEARNTATIHEKAIAGWQQAIDESVTELPSFVEIDRAQKALEEARQKAGNGVLIRAALARQGEADLLEIDRVAAVKRSEMLRDLASSVLGVLARAVAPLVPGLKLDGELRIIVPHAKRGTCYFQDLSHGERWRLALDLAVEAFRRKGQLGVLAVPQEAWEGLDAINREIIAEHVAKTDLIVFTAEAETETTEMKEELSVEVLGIEEKSQEKGSDPISEDGKLRQTLTGSAVMA